MTDLQERKVNRPTHRKVVDVPDSAEKPLREKPYAGPVGDAQLFDEIERKFEQVKTSSSR